MFYKRFLPLIIISFLLGMGVDYFVVRNLSPFAIRKSAEHFEIRKKFGFRLIDPLIECETTRDARDNEEMNFFEKPVAEVVKRDVNMGKISSASVYFRDLSNGPWYSVGPVKEFAPASLLKVPIMLSILLEAEKNPDILKRKVKFDVPEDLYVMQNIKPPVFMERGKFYTVEDLLFRMIAYSDNNATYLLEDVVNPAIREELFDDAGMESPYKNPDKNFHVSAQQYASFFRMLYNASYLSKEMSEKALQYMTESTFRTGLVAGVPANIVVAHKFGERRDEADPRIKHLSDCGIVYYPSHPYLLCVMTRGSQFENLDNTIAEISRVVYQEIFAQYH
ncbi:MAG: serine hydrolase [Nitrospirae bacterium]|nr:serine hydrolase [Nitrospirota bacterium]